MSLDFALEWSESSGSAIVVTFHPGPDVPGNLAALRAQLASIIVVDNGSTPEELATLFQLSKELGLTLIQNGENLGIATALNIGIRCAQSQSADWVLLFDQDSCVTEGFVRAMLEGFQRSRWGDRLAIQVPRYLDRRLQVVIPPDPVAVGLEAAMTSGSLIGISTFERFGYFADPLFIDAVDYEYSLRLRAAGMVLDEVPEAVLLHSPGEPRVIRLFGLRLFQTANYSPVRRYYQERNKIYVSRRYLTRFPVFCLKLAMFSTKDFVKILIAEQDSIRKARFFLRGVWDGLTEKMGRLEK